MPEKTKRTGQDIIVKKRHKDVKFHPLREKLPTCTNVCMAVSIPNLIMLAMFQTEIFRGYSFTGVIFLTLFIDFCMGLTTFSANVLPMM